MNILIEEYGGLLLTCLAVTVSLALFTVLMYDYQRFGTFLINGLMY